MGSGGSKSIILLNGVAKKLTKMTPNALATGLQMSQPSSGTRLTVAGD